LLSAVQVKYVTSTIIFGRIREDAINAVERELGYPPFGEKLLIAAG
jgi:hypothetical protein